MHENKIYYPIVSYYKVPPNMLEWRYFCTVAHFKGVSYKQILSINLPIDRE